MKIIYTASATVTEGRAGGHARSSDGELDVRLVQPKEMGGPGTGGTNPEQLFAAGYAACFQSACRHVAKQQGKTVTGSSVTAHVGIGPREAGGFGLQVELQVKLEGLSTAEAQDIAAKVHASVCPYSNAIRGNVDVALRVV
jgi:Ohr subfamily peroxiredoxin